MNYWIEGITNGPKGSQGVKVSLNLNADKSISVCIRDFKNPNTEIKVFKFQDFQPKYVEKWLKDGGQNVIVDPRI